MLELSVDLVLAKYLWIEQNLPKYVTTRLSKTLLGENSVQLQSQVSINAIVIDVIYAFVKNSNWHSSSLFHEALTQHLLDRYEVFVPNTIDAARDLLGNSTSMRLDDPNKQFLVSYLTAWHHFPFSLDSEKYCGLGSAFYNSIRERSSDYVDPTLLELLTWFSERIKLDQMWQADEWRLAIDLYPEEHDQPVFGKIFEHILALTETRKSSSHTGQTQYLALESTKLQKLGVIFQADESGKKFGLSKVGQQLTARYAAMVFKDNIETNFLDWCEPWQKASLVQKGELRGRILQSLLQNHTLPKLSAIQEYIRALEEEFKNEFVKEYVVNLLDGDLGIWVKTAILASSKHLLDEQDLPKYAASLIDSPSTDVQRAAADILFG
jgi:hypothetical protein